MNDERSHSAEADPVTIVPLGSVNRSASPEAYWWINVCGFALSLLIAKMSFSAYGSTGALDKAWVCVVCQALAIAMAILARRAFTAEMMFAGLVATAGAAGCAWWASHGLALAWSQGGDSTNDWMVFFLTALEPGLFLLAEHVKEGRAAQRAEKEKVEREQAELLADMRSKKTSGRHIDQQQQNERPDEVEFALRFEHELGKSVEPRERPTGRLTASERTSGLPVDRALLPQPLTQTGLVFADAEAHARHLIIFEGIRVRNELARRVRGLSSYRAAQILDELTPGWRKGKRHPAGR